MDAAPRHAASSIDPKLLARVAKGDQQAFGQLYDQSSTLLFTLAYRILSNRDEAAELLQDVYLEVWRKIAKYDVGRGSPIAWLVTLTRSRAIDRLRARASRGQQVVADSFDHPWCPSRLMSARTRMKPVRTRKSGSSWRKRFSTYRFRNSRPSKWPFTRA